MNHTRTAAIVGGDVRQVFLGELLAADGMRVGTVGLERHVCDLPIFCDMAALFAEADVVLLPMPVLPPVVPRLLLPEDDPICSL